VRRWWRPAGLLVAASALALGCAAGSSRPGDPLGAAEHNDLGVAYHAAGQHALAAQEFERALAQRPGWGRAAANLGDARLALGDQRGAIASYEAALAAMPDDPAIANNLAWALLGDGDRWREAEPLVRRALARDPEPRGYYLDTLGVALLRRGAAPDAVAAFRAALGDPGLADRTTRAEVLRHAGAALRQAGQPRGATHCEAQAALVEAGRLGGLDAVC
jgi:tetratricopeptide (TPR) repeat protein